MEIEQYHNDFTALSSSMLKQFAFSGRHFLAYKTARENGENKTSDAMALGTCVHSLMDDKNDYTIIDFALRPQPDKDFRTKENAAWKRDLMENAINPIEKEEFERAEKMANGIKNSDFFKALSKLGELEGSEKTYETELHGLKVKCRVDKIYNFDDDHVLIVDWKSTKEQLKKDYFQYEYLIKNKSYNYHISMVHYCEIIKAVTGKNVIFCFVFVENSEPYDIMPVYISMESKFYDEAQTKWLDLILRAKFAIENNCFEGVSGVSYELAKIPESDMSKLEIIKKFSSINLL